MTFFTELELIILKLILNHRKTEDIQSNLEKEKLSCKYNIPGFQTTLQYYSNQNSMALAQRQKHRSRGQNRNPRNKSTLTLSMTKKKIIYKRVRSISSINNVGRIGQRNAKKLS